MTSASFGLFWCVVFFLMSVVLSAQDSLFLNGIVSDALEMPIAGVDVLLITQERVRQTNSEANGSFAFHQIPAGRYEVEVTAPGFTKQKISLNFQDHMIQLPLSITLRVGDQPDMELCGSHASVVYGPLGEASSQLSGTVQDYVHKKALQNVEVTIWKVSNLSVVFQTHSDVSGRFRFESLPADRYNIQIAKPGYRPINMERQMKPRENALAIHALLLQQNARIACQ